MVIMKYKRFSKKGRNASYKRFKSSYTPKGKIQFATKKQLNTAVNMKYFDVAITNQAMPGFGSAGLVFAPTATALAAGNIGTGQAQHIGDNITIKRITFRGQVSNAASQNNPQTGLYRITGFIPRDYAAFIANTLNEQPPSLFVPWAYEVVKTKLFETMGCVGDWFTAAAAGNVEQINSAASSHIIEKSFSMDKKMFNYITAGGTSIMQEQPVFIFQSFSGTVNIYGSFRVYYHNS